MSGSDWRTSLRNLPNKLRSAEARLRFNRSWAPISSVAKQFYCEAKVDNAYRFGKVPSEAKEEGSKLHDEILAMKPTTIDNLIRSIERKNIFPARFPVYGEINSFLMAGIPDVVLFVNSKPLFLIELKTTGGDVRKIWRDEIVQVKAYALSLDLMGFDCSKLSLLLIRLRREKMDNEDKILPYLTRLLLRNGVDKLSMTEHEINEKLGVKLKLYALKYDKNDAIKDILWAMEYWLMRREAKPTTKVEKCMVCEFRETCDHSLVMKRKFSQSSHKI